MTFAIIAAAGHSTRMGRAKLSLPLGDRTVLQHVIAALLEGGVNRVVVVIGPHVPELIRLAEAASAEVCLLLEATPDMRSTVEHGLRWLEDHYHPRPEDWWLLAPGDHPGFGADVSRQLLAAAGRGDHSIVVPVHGGLRGHPTAIQWKHAAGIRNLPAGEGINRYLRAHEAETFQLEVSEAGVLMDLDTPEDYAVVRSLRDRTDRAPASDATSSTGPGPVTE
jgi:molybdenum cofactor cytidylyltransferase